MPKAKRVFNVLSKESGKFEKVFTSKSREEAQAEYERLKIKCLVCRLNVTEGGDTRVLEMNFGLRAAVK